MKRMYNKEYREKNLRQCLKNQLKNKILELQNEIRFKAFDQINILEELKSELVEEQSSGDKK